MVQVDGQLKTGRDVVIAALLGAEEFSFATAPLVVSGCIMMRVCHLDTCPVGVATQNPLLRERFSGKPEFVENFFLFIAEEVRELMAQLGFRTVNEMVGHVDALDTAGRPSIGRPASWTSPPVLHAPDSAFMNQDLYCSSRQDHGLDKALDQQLIVMSREALDSMHPGEVHHDHRQHQPHRRHHARPRLTKAYGANGLPDGTIDITFEGSAGNSFGAFVPGQSPAGVRRRQRLRRQGPLSGRRIVLRPPDNSPEGFVAGTTSSPAT